MSAAAIYSVLFVTSILIVFRNTILGDRSYYVGMFS